MNKLKPVLALLLGIVFITSCTTGRRNLPDSAFTPLFDGKTLNGWQFVGKGQGYLVEDGAIVCSDKGGGHLFTQKQYSDFILRLDFKLAKGANNGIGIRAPIDRGHIAYLGSEIQILDDDAHPNLQPAQYCGSVYGVAPAKRGFVRPAGEWNNYEIIAKGRQITVVLNGHKVVDLNVNDVSDPAIIKQHPGLFRPKGHIGLLGHGTRVEFRNIRIYEFPHYIERNNTPPEGFTALFNGRDLTGWRGLVADPIKRPQMSIEEWARQQVAANELMQQNWKVENGTVTYHGKKFDNLCTEKDYGNFELLVDWKIGEPKADSGIYLRGCPQVQIWEPESGGYDKAHPGSGGLFNNQKSPNYPSQFADHYASEWNRFRIIMIDDKVHVFLNNELVVNNITLENYWERAKPVYTTGPIELQAHTSQVPFRNVYIREIPRRLESQP